MCSSDLRALHPQVIRASSGTTVRGEANGGAGPKRPCRERRGDDGEGFVHVGIACGPPAVIGLRLYVHDDPQATPRGRVITPDLEHARSGGCAPVNASHRIAGDERAYAREARRVGQERTGSNSFAKELACRGCGSEDRKDARVHHKRIPEVQVRVTCGQAKCVAPTECNRSEVIRASASARQSVVPSEDRKSTRLNSSH